MIAPWFLVFLALSLYPLFYGLYLSFTNDYGFNMTHLKNVGFHNYHNVFTDTDAISSMVRTLVLMLITIPIGTAITLLLSLLLNRNVRGKGTYRTIFYLPSILPVISTVMMWKFMFTNNGVLNTFLGWFGVDPINWLDYNHAKLSLIIMMLWGAGGSILVILAGLKAIPGELYEASSIDGASYFQNLVRITIPLLTPALFFNMVTGFINGIQIYLQPIMLTSAPDSGLLTRPIDPIYLYGVHAFQSIFAFQRYGYGMALLWVSFIVTLVLSIFIFTTSKYWVYYETEQEGKQG